MKDAQAYRIRYLTAEDLDAYNNLLRYAFQVTEQDLMEAGWRGDEIKQSKFPVLGRVDVLGCFDGEELVSQFAVYPLKMNLYGGVCPVGFVTSVCTYPEYTGKGIMKRLMHRSLSHMRETNRPLALLYPYSIPLYRRLGWEIISDKISYTVKDRQLPAKAQAPGYVRRVEWDAPDFMNLHARFAQARHGCLYRNSLAWEEYWRWDEDDTTVAVYYTTQDEPMGYMVYLIKEDVMHIKEMISLNHEAQRGLWEYIRAHDSMIDEVRGNNYDGEPIAFEMDDGDIREMIRPYIMGRIIDVEGFFGLYRCRPDAAEVRIRFEVEDPFLDWNNRPLTVRFCRGGCCVEAGEAKPAACDGAVRLSIGTLTTLLLGYKTAAQLSRLERLEASEQTVEALDRVLLHIPPYISDYI